MSIRGEEKAYRGLAVESCPVKARRIQQIPSNRGSEVVEPISPGHSREDAGHSPGAARFVHGSVDVPIVVVTSHDDETVALQVVENGPPDFMTNGRPTGDRLARATRYAIERYRFKAQLRPAAASLHGSEGRYRPGSDESVTGDCVFSATGSLRACNEAFVDNFGFSTVAAAFDWRFEDFFPDTAAREDLLHTLRRDGKAERFEIKGRGRKGVGVSLSGSAFAIFDEGGELAEFHAFLAEEKCDERLLQQQRMEAMGRLAAGAAHDFNNVLTSIMFNAEYLLGKLSADDPCSKRVSEIKLAAKRAASLTGQLLSFSRPKIHREAKLLDLNEIVVDVKLLLERVLGEDIVVRQGLADGLWQVRADPIQLEQVLLNLAVNSRDAMPYGGHLTLETANVEFTEEAPDTEGAAPFGAYVLLAVGDTGTGLDPDLKSSIFEPFFTTKEIGRGTGLGLSTVREIVERSQGYISVESKVDGGTTFRVYLPRAEKQARPAPLWEPSGCVSPGTETILVVEDDQVLRDLMLEGLMQEGYRALGASSGSKALAKTDDTLASLDLVITDVVMPDIQGPELVSKLRARRQTLKVLYMSGYIADESLLLGIEAARIPFLAKPFNSALLTTKIREVLDGAGNGDEPGVSATGQRPTSALDSAF